MNAFTVCLLAFAAALFVSSVSCNSRNLQVSVSSSSRASSRGNGFAFSSNSARVGPFGGQISSSTSEVSGNARARGGASTPDTSAGSAAASEGDGSGRSSATAAEGPFGGEVSSSESEIDGTAAAGSLAETDSTGAGSGVIGFTEDAEAEASGFGLRGPFGFVRIENAEADAERPVSLAGAFGRSGDDVDTDGDFCFFFFCP